MKHLVLLRKKWFGLGFAIISLTVLPIIFLYPFNVDTDHWQWISSMFVRYGGLPYVAAWDHDFPGIMLVHATAMSLFGSSMLAFRLIEYIAILATVLMLYKVSRLWLSEAESFVSSFIFALFYAYGRWDCMGQRDNFAVLPILLAVYWYVQAERENGSNRRYWRIASASALIGLAFCIRPTHALLLLVPILTLYGISNLRAILSSCAGFAVPVALMIAPYLFVPAGLHRAYVSTFLYNKPIVAYSWHSDTMNAYLHDLGNLRAVAVYVLIGLWLLAYSRLRMRGTDCGVAPGRERTFLFLFYATQLLGIFMQTTLPGHHYTPFFACFIPVMVKTTSTIIPQLKWRKFVFTGMLALLVATLYPFGLAGSFIQSGFSIDAAYRYLGRAERLSEASYVASYVTQRTQADDYVTVIGDPAVAWRIPRRNSSVFPSEWYFVLNDFGPITSYQRRWRAAYLDSLECTLPRYLIIGRDPHETPATFYCRWMKHTPEIAGFIRQHYGLDRLLDDDAIYVWH